MPTQNPLALAKQLLAVLADDLPNLERFDGYLRGDQDDPYMPPQADAEYRLLAARSVSNWMPLLVNTPTQALYVEGFRPSNSDSTDSGKLGADTSISSPEWDHWERSRLSSRQISLYAGAFTHGHAFTLTEDTARGIITKGLSALRTAALYEDPANDDTPYVALTVTRWGNIAQRRVGMARMWDDTYEYAVAFTSLSDQSSVRVSRVKSHGASECPVTRFAATIDLQGRTVGVVEPMIPLQNRINQTVFDLLVAQTYGSFKVRYATGMAPPIERDSEGNPVLDSNGNPKPIPMNHNARRFLFAEDEAVKFGSLDETPLDGFIKSIDMSIRHLAAVSQTPPHHLLGQIANLSADALIAAETALQRKIQEFRTVFGESWERVFRLAAELGGHASSATDFRGEVLWRDMENRSLAQSADALGKMSQQLQIPARGLWQRVPGVTPSELAQWEQLAEEQDPALGLGNAIRRATPDPAPAGSSNDFNA